MTQQGLPKAREICPMTTHELVKDNALLVDVREPSEVAHLAFDVPNLVTIPLGELQRRFSELPRDCELVIACKAGGRSLKATYFLMNCGFDKVANMEGGIINWAGCGLPVKRGA